VLDHLAEHGARATFFVCGRYVDERPELVARTVREGHELGNHTYDHVDCAHERDDDVLRDQIRRTSDAIERAAGVAPRLMRPPYGKDVCRVARLAGEQQLAPTVLWSVQAWDWDEPPADEIVARILRDCRPGAIVLLHDGAPPYDSRSREQTAIAVGRLLPALAAEGYDVLTVSELLATHGAPPQPGTPRPLSG
jgi:peptidoglycan-N-acetylglucosamine deacetylase